MLFAEVIGQQNTKQHLLEMVHQNRLSHALLFSGKKGSGALPLGFFGIFRIHQFTCHHQPNKMAEPSLFGEPVGAIEPVFPKTADEADTFMQKQPAFSKANNYVHPDIHFSYPVIPKKTGDKPVSTDYSTEWREFVQQYAYGNVYGTAAIHRCRKQTGNITADECNDIIP